jgi:hypothetical protein
MILSRIHMQERRHDDTFCVWLDRTHGYFDPAIFSREAINAARAEGMRHQDLMPRRPGYFARLWFALTDF